MLTAKDEQGNEVTPKVGDRFVRLNRGSKFEPFHGEITAVHGDKVSVIGSGYIGPAHYGCWWGGLLSMEHVTILPPSRPPSTVAGACRAEASALLPMGTDMIAKEPDRWRELTDEEAMEVGRQFMKLLPAGYHWNGSPIEYMTQILDENFDLRHDASAIADREREACAGLCELIRDDWANADMNLKACAADYLVERIKGRSNAKVSGADTASAGLPGYAGEPGDQHG